MAAQPDSPTDAERLIAALGRLDYLPTWTQASALGVRLVDLSGEEIAIRDTLADFDAIVDPNHAEALTADVADHQARLSQIEFRPGRYFLASGDTVQYDTVTDTVQVSGQWYNDRATPIHTPTGDRVHQSGIHPTANIDPRATVDPLARVEAGATIGPHAFVGAYAHVGRDATIGPHSVIQKGAWIGAGSELGGRTCIAPGAYVEPHCVIGEATTVGSGARLSQGTTLKPFARIGAGTTTSSGGGRMSKGAQLANGIENIMRLDRE